MIGKMNTRLLLAAATSVSLVAFGSRVAGYPPFPAGWASSNARDDESSRYASIWA